MLRVDVEIHLPTADHRGAPVVVELLRVIHVVHPGGGTLTDAGYLQQFPGCPSGSGDNCDSSEDVPDYNIKK